MSGTQIRCDTHVVAFLDAGHLDRLSPVGRELVAQCALVVSPLVELELTHLHEIGRLAVSGAAMVGDLQNRIGLRPSEQPLSAVVSAAAGLTWTRDPFDRLSAADASAAACQLLTKDRAIRNHFDLAVW